MKTAARVWPGKTLNLSPYGVKVTFEQPVKLLPETKIRLQLVLPDQGPPLSLTASVVRSDDDGIDRKSTRLNSSHIQKSRMPSSA